VSRTTKLESPAMSGTKRIKYGKVYESYSKDISEPCLLDLMVEVLIVFQNKFFCSQIDYF